MRRCVSILLGLLIGGCAAKPAPPTPVTVEPHYDEAVAAALVYDPPVVAVAPPTDFSRTGRGPSAFVGFDEVITTYYYLYIDDRQGGYGYNGTGGSNGWGRSFDRYDRQAITQRVGVSYR
jgi:hypothetical protein